MNKLGPVGEDEKNLRAGDAVENLLQGIFRTLVYPMQILDSDDEGADIRSFENDLLDGFDDPVLLASRLIGILSMPLSFTERSSRR